MATRSAIIDASDPARAQYIRVHWDGYLSGVGATLLKDYTDPAKIRELIQLGDLATLRNALETCNAYHRDRGEPYRWNAPRSGALEDALATLKDSDADYIYLWRNGSWEYSRNRASEFGFKPLTEQEIAND